MEKRKKYTVCVPGVGTSSASSITELSVRSLGFAQLVEAATGDATHPLQGQQSQPENKAGPYNSNTACLQPTKRAPFNMVWLDVEQPTEDDIVALARIFDIDGVFTERLLKSTSPRCLPEPECLHRDDSSMYACWAETTTYDASTESYLSKGTFRDYNHCSTDDHNTTEGLSAEREPEQPLGSGEDRGGGWIGQYIPTFPWLQPSATEVHSRFHLEKKRQTAWMRSKNPSEWKLESARRQHVDQLLNMLYRLPAVANKQRTLQAIDRWGPGYEQWRREVVSSASVQKKQSRSENQTIADQVGRNFRNLIGYRLVQVWICGRIVLTFHTSPSAAIRNAMDEMVEGVWLATKVTPLAVIQSMVERWVHATKESLRVLEKYADRLDHDLTHPVQSQSQEAAKWTPVIARCRKVSLALLRRCQTNEYVLTQMCSAAHSLLFPQKWMPGRMQLAVDGDDFSTVPLPFGRHMAIGDIVESRHPKQQLGILVQQKAFVSDTRKRYKQVEQRLSRLHRIMLDRQRLRLLAAQKDIQQYFRIIVTVEIVFMPIELWHNLDNLNGITTPGTLQPEDASDEDFWLTVLGCIVWAVAGILLYTLYIKFFERGPKPLPTVNNINIQKGAEHSSRS
ncbi:hypothetical protein LPJ72_004315 [Coemansia sp. Benny D160-2]|nr:hypothetical protein LPJ72_004315 [Coemansia sp. Benny D160-2]